MIDRTHPVFGAAVDVFLRDWDEPLVKVFKDNKDFRHAKSMIAFSEFLGPNSFAGWHDPNEPVESKRTILFDMAIHPSGLLVPREFLRAFDHLPIAAVVYEGNFNHQFRQAVFEGRIPNIDEGVVAKGVLPRKRGNENHGLWMAKAKTKAWLLKLKQWCQQHPEYAKELDDNLKEQEAAA